MVDYERLSKELGELSSHATTVLARNWVFSRDDVILSELSWHLVDTLSALQIYVDNAVEAQELMK